jgi:hypothetical protein
MSYSINNYLSTQIITVNDGTIDKTLDINLIGKNAAGFGKTFNENLVWLLENFASTSAPNKAIPGQIWYDFSAGIVKLKFLTLSGSTKNWKTLAVNNITNTAGATGPLNAAVGDFWYDNITNTLSIFNGTTYKIVSSENPVSGFAATQLTSRSVKDTTGASHPITVALVNGVACYIISSDAEFTLESSINPITGFTVIKPGLTLINSATGVTSTSYRYWGTSSDSDRLGGYLANQYPRLNNASFTSLINFAAAGILIGSKLKIYSATDPIISNTAGDTIVFQTLSGSSTLTPLKLVGSNIIPGATNSTDLGSTSLKFKNVYAGYYYGTAEKSDKSDALNVSGIYRNASASNAPDSIVVRDTNSEITASKFNGSFVGNATSATTATRLSNPRNINGVTFDGTASIEIPFDANLLGGETLKSTVVNSSLTSVGTLTSLRVNGYIKQPVYADAAARNAAITAPEAGMTVFLTSTLKFQGYTGSAWVDLN